MFSSGFAVAEVGRFFFFLFFLLCHPISSSLRAGIRCRLFRQNTLQ